MIERRAFGELGHFQNAWLNSHHHFSFDRYYDPKRMGVGVLRVWNDDEIAPATGFDPHPHRDMEIITYVRQGAITHRDSLGNEGRTKAGDVQVMHAGTGIVHAEYNREHDVTTLFQIWILPNKKDVAPGWGTRKFPRQSGLKVLASGQITDQESGALPLYADGRLIAGLLQAGQVAEWHLAPGQKAYIVPAKGTLDVNGVPIAERDGVAIAGIQTLRITATDDSEVVLVEVAG